MATGGPIERQDLITDDAIMAPLVAEKNFEVLLETLEKIRSSAVQYSEAVGKTDSTKKLSDATAELSKEQQELVKIQNQIATAVARNNDTYRAYQEQLKKINDELKANRAASDDWVKQATAQNSSLIKLEDALNKNRIAYSNLRNEQDRNSKAGKDLLHIIQDQDKGVKALRDSMGQAQAHVGGYAEAIEHALPSIKALAPETVEAGEAVVGLGQKFLAFATSGPVLIFTAIVAAIELAKTAFEAFFERTKEGNEAGIRLSNEWHASVELLKDEFAEIGKTANDLFGSNGHFIAGLQLAAARFLGMSDTVTKLSAKFAEANELSNIQIGILKEELVIGKEIAEAEAAKNKDLFDARDKLRKSDQERFESALASRKELEKEVAKKIQQVDLEIKEAKEEQKFAEDNYKSKQKIADLEVRRIEINNQLYTGQRRTLQLLSSITEESVKNELDADKKIEESKLKTAETIYKNQLDVSQRIVGNNLKDLDEQIEAQKNFVDATVNLQALGVTKQIQAAREAAFQRVKLNSDELDAIFKASGGELEKIVTLTIAAKEKKLESDKAYIDETKAITQDGLAEQARLTREGLEKVGKVIDDYYKSRLAINQRFNKQEVDERLVDLSKQLQNGAITLQRFQLQRRALELRAAQIDHDEKQNQYQAELVDLKKAYDAKQLSQKDYLDKRNELEAKEAENELALNTKVNETVIEGKQRLNATLLQLENQLFQSTLEIGDNLYKKQEDQVNARIELLNKQKDKEIELAGDNAKAKIAIEKDYAARVEVEQKKVRKIQHDQAVFERDVALVKVQVETAKAIAATLPYFSNPLTVGIGVALDTAISLLAIAETAAILSTPIPAYARGRSGGGAEYAVVAEEGPEMVLSGGKAKLYDMPGPTLTYLNAGDKVLTAEQTRKAVESGMVYDSIGYATKQEQAPQVVYVYDPRMIEAVKSNKQSGFDLVAQGTQLLIVEKNRENNRRIIRSKIFTA